MRKTSRFIEPEKSESSDDEMSGSLKLPPSRYPISTSARPTPSPLEHITEEKVAEDTQLWEQFSKESLRTFPRVEVLGIGAFPHIGIIDARCEGVSKADLYEQFSIHELNDELASVVDKDQEARMKDFKCISIKDSMKGLNKFDFDFGAKAHG